jgi:SAM-dependent methyltransferase
MTKALWASTNRANWDDRADAHLAGSTYYDVKGVVAGASSLQPFECELAGLVAGRRLLHLMCHIGLDSISWARLGAYVTAVDFSPVSIVAARRIAIESGVEVDFHIADVYSLPPECNGPFSLVAMTYGVLCWLNDMASLTRLVAERLEPGGRFLLVDGHPLTNLWPTDSLSRDLRLSEDAYFAKEAPERRVRSHSYGGGRALTSPITYQWQHGLAEIVQSVIDAGLRLRCLREEPFGFYRRYPGMVRRPDGYLDPPPGMHGLPMLFGLVAEKP